jgi:hypothetical protein
MIEAHFIGALCSFPQFAYVRAAAAVTDQMARMQQEADLNLRRWHNDNGDDLRCKAYDLPFCMAGLLV